MLQQHTPKTTFPTRPEGCNSLGELHQSLICESIEIIRKTIGLKSNNLPLPKLITHRQYHLDEMWADLLFRAMHTNHAKPEFIIELSQRDRELSYDLHPQILNAVLIGIGGTGETEQNVTIFDEHTASGERLAASASHMLLQRLIAERASTIERIAPLMEEINGIDSKGDKLGGRLGLSALIKGVHLVNTYDPARRYGWILADHKEAVILASLSALASKATEYVAEPALSQHLEQSWQRYVAKAGWVFGSDEAVRKIGEDVQKNATNLALTSLRNVAAAVSNFWPMPIADYIVHTFFETLVQTQQDFLEWLDDERCDERMQVGRYTLERVSLSHTSKLPHRPRTHKLNNSKTPGLVLVYDPTYMTSTLCKNNYVKENVWRQLIDAIKQVEPECWYEVRNPDGTVPFLCNGNRAHLEMPPTKLELRDIAKLIQ